MEKKNIIIGLGTSGSKIVERFMENHALNNTFAMAFDSDENTFTSFSNKVHICDLSANMLLGEAMDFIQEDTVSSFFPTDRDEYNVDAIYMTEMNHGAGGFRMKGLFSFIYYLFDPKKRDDFLSALDKFVGKETEDDYHLYVISSICGGTGSALILAVTFYLKNLFARKYHANLTSSALFACPSIYEGDASSQELKEKMFANAYATMQEINTVNEICDGAKNVEFKLGSEEDQILGLLFDSSYSSFRQKEAAPFNDIYLFDRIIGEFSIYTHEIEISNALFALVSGLKVEKDSGETSPLKCYKTLSTLEIHYPVESIAHYVAGQRLLDIVNDELLYTTNSVNKYIEAEEKAAIECGRKLMQSDDKVKYANEYLASVTESFNEGRYEKGFVNVSDVLLQRKGNEQFAYNMDLEKIISDYLKTFAGSKIELVEKSDANKEIKEELSLNQVRKIKANHFFTFEEKREKREEQLKERIKLDYLSLKNYYFRWVSSYQNGREKYLNSLVSLAEEDKETSLVQKLLIEGGTFIHPSIAYLRLCSFYKLLERRTRQSILKENEFLHIVENENEGIFHRFLRTTSEEMNPKSRYSMLGENRLGKYLIGHYTIEKMSKVNKDEVLDFYPNFKEGMTVPYFDDIAFLSDCNEVVEKINREIPLFYFRDMQILVKKLIDGYQAFFTSLSSASVLFADEVEENLKNGSESTKLFIHVGASALTKKEACSDYLSMMKNEENYFKDTDALLGHHVFDFIYTHKDDTESVSKENTYHLLDEIKAIFLSQYEETALYQNLANKNVISVLEESLNKKEDYEDLYIYMVEASHVNYHNDEDYPLRHICPTYVSVSASTAENLSEGQDNALKAVNDKMDTLLTFDAEADIAGGLDDKTILFYKSVVDLSIHNFDHFDADNPDGYFRHYQNALALSEKYKTELWNPHLYKSKSKYHDLPLIKNYGK